MRPLVAAAAFALAFVSFAGPSPAAAGNGKALLPLVGDTAEAVIVVDVADARKAKTLAPVLEVLSGAIGSSTATVTALGIDPVADVDTMLAASGDGAKLVVLEGKVVAKVADALAADRKATAVRGVSVWEVDAGTSIARVGKRLLIGDADEVAAAIARSKQKKGNATSLTRSGKAAAIRGAISLTDTRHDVWVAIAGGAIKRLGADFEAASIGASLGDEVVLELRGRAVDEAAATTLHDEAAKALPQLGTQLGQVGLAGTGKSLEIEREERVIELRARIPGDELASLLSLAQMF